MNKATYLRAAIAIVAIAICRPALSEDAPPVAAESAPAKSPLDLITDLFGPSSPPAETKAAPAAPQASPAPAEQTPVNSVSETAPTADSPQPPAANTEILTNYASALREAQLSNRPLFVLLGARWCGWCRKLEAEIEMPEAQSMRAEWVIVKIDVDDEPEIATRLQASALPGLRILGPLESLVASREGYVELPELKEWLATHRKTADPALHRVLFETAPPDDAAVEQLIAMLAEPAPSIRTAAAERLAAHPTTSAIAMVQVLKTGRLMQQLMACEVLRRWGAPLGEIDPWQPQSLLEESTGVLIEWAKSRTKEHISPEANDGLKPEPLTSLDAQTMNDLLRRLIEADASQRASLTAQLLGGGKALVAEIRMRLAQTDQLDDAARKVLRALLYNLLAGPQLKLERPGVLAALAQLDAETHRQAAATILETAVIEDRPIINELVRDPDPLVRELAVRALGRLQLLTESDQVQQLLADSSPNVRTSVLRALAEHPSDQALDSLCTYLGSETDEDLLVHGAKCLAQLGGQPQAMAALAKLAVNSSWRVRAAAIDATGGVIESSSRGMASLFSRSGNGLPKELISAIVAAAFGEDAFVADRALKLMPRLMIDKLLSEESMEMIAIALADHPEKLDLIVGGVEEYSRKDSFAPIVKLSNRWLKSNDRQQMERAVQILSKLAPAQLNHRIADVLRSSERSVRIAGMRAAISSAAAYRTESIEAATGVWALYSEEANPRRHPRISPWYDSPTPAASEAAAENPSVVSKAAQQVDATLQAADAVDVAADFFTADTGASSTQPAAANESGNRQSNAKFDAGRIQETPPSALDAVAGLFGGLFESEQPSNTNASAPADMHEAEMATALPSRWMKRWNEDVTRNRPKWLANCEAPTRELLASEDAAERAWATALWLVLGHTDRVDELLSLFDDSAKLGNEDHGVRFGQLQLISWLPSEYRLKQCQKRVKALDSDQTKITETLVAATEVDDESISNYIFDEVAETDWSDPTHRSELVRLILRSRVGAAADSLDGSVTVEQYQYSTVAAYSIINSLQANAIPGRIEACEWLREKYHDSTNDHRRATALLTVAKLDHQTAVNAALGAIDAAEADNELTQAALAIALTDAPKASAQRAMAWLHHPVPEVRRVALRFLASPAPLRDRHAEQWKDSIPTYSNHSDVLPGFVHCNEPLPIAQLQALVKSNVREQKPQATLLLLAADQPTNLAQLEVDLREQSGEFSRLCIAAALAKVGKTDAAAIRYYEDTFTEASDDRIPVALYGALRRLKGEQMIELRRNMRKKKRAELFNNETQSGFVGEGDLFGF